MIEGKLRVIVRWDEGSLSAAEIEKLLLEPQLKRLVHHDEEVLGGMDLAAKLGRPERVLGSQDGIQAQVAVVGDRLGLRIAHPLT